MSLSNGDCESAINEPGRGFLGCLTPSVVQHYPYRGKEQFLDDFQHAIDATSHTTEWFLVTGVNSEIFTREFLESDNRPFSSWCSYDAELELLLLRMIKSAAHEAAAEAFQTMLIEAIAPTGMSHSLQALGGATRFAIIGNKEPDKSWVPFRIPRGRSNNWPSVVLEVAYSETTAKLQSDIRYWLRASQGDVKIVFTLKIARNKPRITIEKWEINENGRVHLETQVTISRNGGSVIIYGSPLTIGFEKLFLRPPSIPRERNIEIDENGLEFLATAIWHQQRF
ncbi:hypothetical protein BJX76DRAFT_368903 [Aspergillus varians]